MIIRKTKLQDYEQIKKLWEANNMLLSIFNKVIFSKMLEKNKELYFVAEDDNKIIGSIFATHDGGYYAYIYKLFVKEGHRRKGIASNLLERVFSNLKKQNIPWIYAHIEKTNSPSLNLFKNFGFKIRDTPYLIDDG